MSETAFSTAKRSLGSAVRSRVWYREFREVVLLFAVHNVKNACESLCERFYLALQQIIPSGKNRATWFSRNRRFAFRTATTPAIAGSVPRTSLRDDPFQFTSEFRWLGAKVTIQSYRTSSSNAPYGEPAAVLERRTSVD